MGGAAPDNKLAFRAALSRILIAGLFLLLQPFVLPTLTDVRWVLAGYLTWCLVGQYLIWKDLGGEWRALIYGVFDLALISYLVHELGSVATAVVSLYIYLGVVNALVTTRRVALALAIAGSAGYALLLYLEWAEHLPHAPSAVMGTFDGIPGRPAIAAAVLVATLMIGTTAMVARLVEAIREHQLLLQELSLRDPLTQLYNRRHLMERVERELGRVRRGHPLALLLVDLDRFKIINDKHGHLQGDELLRRISAALQRATRETDVPGRFGGDEFVVVLPDTTAEQARGVAQRLIEDVRAVGAAYDGAAVTASVGLAIARDRDRALDVLERADAAAYRAKARGGDQLEESQ